MWSPPKRLAQLAVALLLCWGVAACGDKAGNEAKSTNASAATEAAPARVALSVSLVPVVQQQWPLMLTANGNVAAWQEASVGSESNGLRLAEVRVNVGDVVKKGQVLAVFAGDTVRADVAQAQASLAEAEANAADAKGNAERALTLQETGALSQQQINQYQTAAKTAQARVEAARAMLAAQQVRGRNVQVLAPDDGIISARSATVGSVVGAGTELFRLIRQGRLEWRAEVSGSELERIQAGQSAELALPSGSTVSGKVRAVAPTLDAATRNALVYVDLAPHPGVKAGMFARGHFVLEQQAAQTVPQAAVVPRDGFNHVVLYQGGEAEQGPVALRKVQLGRRQGDRVEVVGELPAGARVVLEGAGFLADGDTVRVVPALATGAASGSAASASDGASAPAVSSSATPAPAASTSQAASAPN